jgi:4-amino-4-deoxy-L-arabinose transferase-like glycosyltransferase
MAKPQRVHVNFWAFLQATLIHSINKGQFPGACVAGLLALIILKMPQDEVAILAKTLVAGLKSAVGVSYAFNVILLVGWAIHARWQRSSISGEMDRIGREKSRLQEDSTGRKLTNSGKKGA